MTSEPNTLIDLPLDGSTIVTAKVTENASSRSPRVVPRYWFQSGFYAALGVAILCVGALITWKLGSAILDIATPFVIAIVLALLLDPLVDNLERRGMKRGAGVAVIFGGFMLVVVGIGLLIIPSLISQASQLSHEGPKYVQQGQIKANEFLASHRTIGSVQLPENVQALSTQFSSKASEFVQGASGRIAGILLGSLSAIVDGLVALISTFYLLMDIDRLRARLYYLAPERARVPIAQYTGDVGSVFSHYLRGLMIVCALYGATTIVLLCALGFVHAEMRHYALLLGILAGLLFAVPYVGTVSSALAVGVLGLVAGGPAFGAICVVIVIALNQVFDHIITPRVIGGGVGLHPVLTIFALVLGGELFGLPGLLLSVPLAASIQVILFRLFPKLNSPTPDSFIRAQMPTAQPLAQPTAPAPSHT